MPLASVLIEISASNDAKKNAALQEEDRQRHANASAAAAAAGEAAARAYEQSASQQSTVETAAEPKFRNIEETRRTATAQQQDGRAA